MEQHYMHHMKKNCQIHDLWAIMLFLCLFLHRETLLDYSSLWQVGILSIVYLLTKRLEKRFILVGITLWSTIESLLAIL